MKLTQYCSGICLAWFCCVQGTVADQNRKPNTVTPTERQSFKDCDECPEMVVIPTGTFLMGSSPEIGKDIEKPQRRVNIQSFEIGKYEVTQEQWYAVMGSNPSRNNGRTLPVENVSWDDAQLFVQKLSQKTGKKYRLPSEAEWEYAARAGTTTQYFWGYDEKLINDYAWHLDSSGGKSQPVGLKKPNQFSLFDMSGNVWEWTQDCWNENYKGAPTDGSAWTNENCSRRVLRGGSWGDGPRYLRTAIRVWLTTANRGSFYGLRVARAP